jgi:hypothetical protein
MCRSAGSVTAYALVFDEPRLIGAAPCSRGILTGVTARDELKRLVADLGEEQASRALGMLEPLVEDLPGHGHSWPLPAFVGIGDSGRSDISEHINDLLSDGFGL